MKQVKQCRFCGCSYESEPYGSSYCMPAHAQADKATVEIEPAAIVPPAIHYRVKEPSRLEKVKQGRRYSYASHKAVVDAELQWRKRAKEAELRLAAKYKTPSGSLA